MLSSWFESIGKYAPFLIITYTGYQLVTIKARLFGMLGTVLVSYVLNVGLKRWLKHPRPDASVFADSEIQRYGMPSGHMQIFTAVAAYYWLTMRMHPVWEWMSIGGLLAVSAAERYITNKHSVVQLVVGGVIGTITGWATYIMSRKNV